MPPIVEEQQSGRCLWRCRWERWRWLTTWGLRRRKWASICCCDKWFALWTDECIARSSEPSTLVNGWFTLFPNCCRRLGLSLQHSTARNAWENMLVKNNKDEEWNLCSQNARTEASRTRINQNAAQIPRGRSQALHSDKPGFVGLVKTRPKHPSLCSR